MTAKFRHGSIADLPAVPPPAPLTFAEIGNEVTVIIAELAASQMS